MPKELLVKIYGIPKDSKRTITKTKTKERYFYKPVISSRGNITYELEVMLEDSIVVGWKEH